MDNNNIPVLYRSIDSDAAMKAHYLGRLWFRSLEHFRKVEGASRDELEGLIAYTLGEGEYPNFKTYPAFIMCYSKQPLPKYGTYTLEIEDPRSLAEHIRLYCPKGTKVEWQKVTYDKTEHVDGRLPVREEWHRMHYAKPPCFADEKEWRLLIRLPPPFWLFNDTLKLRVGRLGFPLLKAHRTTA